MEEYLLFLGKILATVVVGIGLILLLSYLLVSGDLKHTKGKIVVRHINKQFFALSQSIKISIAATEETDSSLLNDSSEEEPKNIYLLSFNGDIKASQVDNLRQEITAILQVATSQDQVVVKLTSPGGYVHSYGFAASQLARIKDRKIPLTVCVDYVAASGGYMMACVADHLIAAPYAIIGSIGVVAEVPNFHRWLQERKIDYDVYTAGKFKRTLTILGQNTQEGKSKFTEELENTHGLFKQHIAKYRSSIDLEHLATGEKWYGIEALNHGLVDAILTSDDFLLNHSKSTNIYEITYTAHKGWSQKLADTSEELLSKLFIRILTAMQNRFI